MMTTSTEAQVGATFVAVTGKTVGTIVARFDSIGAGNLAAVDANNRWRETGEVHPTFTLSDGVAVVVRKVGA